MRQRTSLLAAAVAALLTAGCGASSPPGGRELFTHACGACHTLTGVDVPSRQGGDLLKVHLSRAVLLQFAREMPVHPPLTMAELETVTSYILAVQRRRG